MTEVRQIPPESLHLSLGETKVWKACVSCGPAVVGKESPGVSETTPPPPPSSLHLLLVYTRRPTGLEPSTYRQPAFLCQVSRSVNI